MRKNQFIVTCLLDDVPETLADRLQAALDDNCPVELVINGRRLIVTMTSTIQDSRGNDD